MDIKKLENNKIFYYLNTLGMQCKKDTLGKPVTEIVEVTCSYFCSSFCKYSDYCKGVIEESQLPWCPLEELR